MSKDRAEDNIADDHGGLKQIFSRTCDVVNGLCESLKNARNYRHSLLEALKRKQAIKPPPPRNIPEETFRAEFGSRPEGADKKDIISPVNNPGSDPGV